MNKELVYCRPFLQTYDTIGLLLSSNQKEKVAEYTDKFLAKSAVFRRNRATKRFVPHCNLI